MNKSFGGWSADNVIDYTEKFDVVYDDDGQLILESKQTFAHTDDSELPDFEYKYVVRCLDLPRFGAEDNSISIELLMVVLPKYWCPDKIQRIVNGYGGIDSIDDICIDMLLDYGVQFANEYVGYSEDNEDGYYHITDNNEVVDTLNVCASVFEAMNGMRGFILDRTWNMIGTTGWDVLRDVLLGEDMLKASLARFCENE